MRFGVGLPVSPQSKDCGSIEACAGQHSRQTAQSKGGGQTPALSFCHLCALTSEGCPPFNNYGTDIDYPHLTRHHPPSRSLCGS